MDKIWTSLLLSTLLALLAYARKALTFKALVLAWICSVIITYCGGPGSFAILAATFIFTIIAGKIGKHRRSFEKQVHAKTGMRDAVQIFCNVGVGAILLLAGRILNDSRFLPMYACVMAASLSDSLASELGVLSKAAPVDICTLRKTQRGLSGGVSLLGLAASLLGALLIALTYSLGRSAMAEFSLITLCGFSSALLDSVLGSLLQVKYRCGICGQLTEKTEHCGTPTQRFKGFVQITNDTVNLMCNLFAALFSALLFLH